MNDALWRSLLHSDSTYNAVLPYNLNWAFHPNSATRAYLDKNPFVVLDVGARDGAVPELETLREFVRYFGFDADEEECTRGRAEPSKLREFRLFPYYVGETSGDTTFYLYKQRAESSAFRPDQRYKEMFRGEAFDIESQVTVKSTVLDEIAERERLPAVDLLKLDTQGTELSILRSSPKVLSQASLVEVEVEFVPLYDGQPLFQHVAEFMGDHGFELLYLNRVFGQRAPMYQGYARGQLLFGDALYTLRDDRLAARDNEQIVKHILLLINYGHLDLAHQLLMSHPVVEQELPTVREYFADQYSKSISHRLKRRLSPFFRSRTDKLVALLLHARRHNQQIWDSDRSYPTR